MIAFNPKEVQPNPSSRNRPYLKYLDDVRREKNPTILERIVDGVRHFAHETDQFLSYGSQPQYRWRETKKVKALAPKKKERVKEVSGPQLALFKKYIDTASETNSTPDFQTWQDIQSNPAYTQDLVALADNVDEWFSTTYRLEKNRSIAENTNLEIQQETLNRYHLLLALNPGSTHEETLATLVREMKQLKRTYIVDGKENALSRQTIESIVRNEHGQSLTREWLFSGGELDLTQYAKQFGFDSDVSFWNHLNETSKKDFKRAAAKLLARRYIESFGDFDLTAQAKRAGFSAGNNFTTYLAAEDRQDFKRTIVDTFKREYETSNGKLRVTDFCRENGNISTSTFYSYVKELEGGMENLRKPKEIEMQEKPVRKPIPIQRNRLSTLGRAAAIIGLTIGSLTLSSDYQERYNPEITNAAPQSENYVLAENPDSPIEDMLSQ